MAEHDRLPHAVVERVKLLHRRFPHMSNREIARRVGIGKTKTSEILSGRFKSQADAMRGSRNPQARLDEQLVRKIRFGEWSRLSAREISERLRIPIGTVKNVIDGSTWKHVR